ncbi:hypothetical protein A2U01_0117922, partial [Trifolium medium]|nr:hypothetical protein [Trifolium medium]
MSYVKPDVATTGDYEGVSSQFVCCIRMVAFLL